MRLSVQQLSREMASFAISYIRHVRRSGIEICPPMRFPSAMEIREELEDRRWQWKLYSCAAIARCILKRAIVLHLDLNMRSLKIVIAFQGKFSGNLSPLTVEILMKYCRNILLKYLFQPQVFFNHNRNILNSSHTHTHTHFTFIFLIE